MADDTNTGWNPKVDPPPSPPAWPGPPVYPPPPAWGTPPPPPPDWTAPPPPPAPAGSGAAAPQAPPDTGAPPVPPDAASFLPPSQPAVDGWGMPITHAAPPYPPPPGYPPPPAYPPPATHPGAMPPGAHWVPYGTPMPQRSSTTRTVVRGILWTLVGILWAFIVLGGIGAATDSQSSDYSTGDVLLGLAVFVAFAGLATWGMIYTRKPRR